MKKAILTILVSLFITFSTVISWAEGLPVSKYLEDPEHKNEIFGFYLDAVSTGINIANGRIKPPLFCLNKDASLFAYDIIDKRIKKLQQEKRLVPDMTVDSIIIDLLIEEYPCK